MRTIRVKRGQCVDDPVAMDYLGAPEWPPPAG
jgi:hypothetical protein